MSASSCLAGDRRRWVIGRYDTDAHHAVGPCITCTSRKITQVEAHFSGREINREV